MNYKLIEGGVRRSDGASIPDSMDNFDWVEYQQWLAEGNTPDPQYTEQELIDIAQNQEISGLKGDLQRQMVWLFRMILAVWGVGIDKSLWANADITDVELKQKVAAWKTKLDRLAELGE